jgi:predicted DNA-binding protein
MTRRGRGGGWWAWPVLRLKEVRTISFRLPDGLLAELEREAKARGVSKAALVRESLEAALGRLPRDIAINPKYLEGFGRDGNSRGAGRSRTRRS